MRVLAASLSLLALALIAGCSDGGDQSGTPDTGDQGEQAGTSGSATTTPAGMDDAPATMAETDLAIASTGVYPANPGFSPTTASVAAGTLVHVTFSNDDILPVQHNVVFERLGGSDTVGAGAQTTFDILAGEPGEYAYYCSVGDHRDRGMEGTLTVTA
jgi:plastocyanin